jgi:hypothetical protein
MRHPPNSQAANLILETELSGMRMMPVTVARLPVTGLRGREDSALKKICRLWAQPCRA